MSGPTRAADITVSHGDSFDVVHISGQLTPDDPNEFDTVSQGLGEQFNRPVMVLLDSPGGNIGASLAIGQEIRSRGFLTGVVNDATCTSACALIWLAGTPRFLGTSAKLGFHAAFTISDDDRKVSGPANALVGAYLDRLGLSPAAIDFATEAGPDEMQWLHPADAQRVGIKFEVFPDPAPPPVPAPTPPVAPVPSGSPAEQRAKALVMAYYADWSRTGTDVEALGQYYGDTALFYGGRRSREQIMDEKRKFAIRWPIRHYTVEPNTLFAQCSSTCSVSGVVQWDVSSIERNAHSVGSANIVLRIAPNGSPAGGVILSESGSVLSAHNDTLSSTQASQASGIPPAATTDSASSPAYAAGRQARLEYEAWFNGLPDGDYRRGAEFWAANRSLRPPPSCVQPGTSADWRRGCIAGQTRLAGSDVRRLSDNEFRMGWNSL